ncbi:MAG: hypothetical protein ACKOYK_03930 [Cyanobium sp.]
MLDEAQFPAVLSAYWKCPDPGSPINQGRYEDLPAFIWECFSDEIERAGRRGAMSIPGIPPAPGEDLLVVAERFFQALAAKRQALFEAIDALLATPELLELERIIWS